MGTTAKAVGGYPFLRQVFDRIDDGEVIAALQPPIAKKGRTGRPPYPPSALWRSWLCKYLLNIRFTRDLIEQLHQERALRLICGFSDTVPSESVFSRFHAKLLPHQPLIEACLDRLTGDLQQYLPGLGRSVAIDSTSIEAYANPNRTIIRDPDARWGVRHSSRAKEGSADYFFGYKMHTLADADHGIPLAYILTPGNTNDSTQFAPVLDKAMQTHDWLRPAYVIADRGYDSAKNHRDALDRGMTPIIHIRGLSPRAKAEEPLYDPIAGAPICMSRTPMEYIQTDPTTGHHLFRCKRGGCELRDKGTKAIIHCDTEVWEDPMENLRIVGVLPRQSQEWKAHYDKRQSVERLFGSLKRSRILDVHFSRNMDRMRLHATLSLVAYQATVMARILQDGIKDLRQMRVGVNAAAGLAKAA